MKIFTVCLLFFAMPIWAQGQKDWFVSLAKAKQHALKTNKDILLVFSFRYG